MARRQLLKTINRAAILNVIKTHGPIARADIARLTGLSPAAVTGLTAGLIADGLIYEKQEGASRGGRRPILLDLDAAGGYVVGIKLAEEHAALALTDLNATIVARHTIYLVERDPQRTSDQLAQGVQRLLQSAQIGPERLLGVGVGVAGIVDAEAGICRISPHNGWHEVPFARYLSERLDCLVYLDNNVNSLTLGEQLYGAGQQVRDFLVITLGRGIGMGIVARGQLYRGAHGGGGELGHLVVEPEGYICNCGNRGCLETVAAEPWMIRRAQAAGLRVSSVEELLAAADQQDAIAQGILQRAGQAIGEALANLVNLFNPALIILSGEGVRLGDPLLAPLRTAMQQHMFGQLAEGLELRIEPVSDDMWARGAASLVLGRIFSVPELE